MGVLHWILAEFRALGWRCVAYGPEFWLASAVICWVVAILIAWIFAVWRNKK
jgi:uncharacterized membrane protein YraQ (UPF0718 family)